jgi:hypothetical protein
MGGTMHSIDLSPALLAAQNRRIAFFGSLSNTCTIKNRTKDQSISNPIQRKKETIILNQFEENAEPYLNFLGSSIWVVSNWNFVGLVEGIGSSS